MSKKVMGREAGLSRRSVVRTGAATVGVLALGGALTERATAKQEKKIKVGQSRVVRLGPNGPTKVYVLELQEATDVVITLGVGTKRGDGDGNANGQDRGDTRASLELFDSSGTRQGSDFIETEVEKTEAQIIVSPLSVGTHRIEASGTSGVADYTLTIMGSLCC